MEREPKFDLMIAHPPCTYLTVTGNRWFNVDKYGDKAIQRAKNREGAIEFFTKLCNVDIEYIAVENPVGVMSSIYRKPEQIIQPYVFGDEARKTTCLWLKNLPKLTPTKIVSQGESVEFASGKRMPKWYADAFKLSPSERQKERSKTFQGIADALAKQWSDYILNNTND